MAETIPLSIQERFFPQIIKSTNQLVKLIWIKSELKFNSLNKTFQWFKKKIIVKVIKLLNKTERIV